MADNSVTENIKFTADTDGAIRNMEALDHQFDKLRLDAIAAGKSIAGAFGGVGSVVKGEAAKIGGSFASMAPAGGALKSLGAVAGPVGLAITAVGSAALGAAAAAGRYADEIDDAATSLNVTTGFLQKHSAAVVLAGGSSEAFEKSMGKLNVKIGDAATGNKAAQASFAAIGVSVTDAQGKIKNNQQVFDEVRGKLAGLGSDTVRLSAANDLFGKGAKDMSGVLKMNAKDYDSLIGQVSKYGIANDSAIQSAGRLGDAGDLLSNTMKAGLINSFAPLTNALGEIAINAIPAVGKAFSFLGGVIDFLSAPLSILGDILGLVWDLFKEGVSYLASAVASFAPFQAIVKSTGDTTDTFRDRYVNVLQAIVRGSTNMAASVVGRFTELQGQIHNIGVSIANFAVDAGLANLFGIKGKIELVDPKAEAARAEAAIRAGGDKAVQYLEGKRAKPTKDRTAESGGTLDGYNVAAAGAGKQSAAQKAAADAAKKFADEEKKLKDAIDDTKRSVEDKALADNLAAAGLSRDTKQVGAQADAIRTLTTNLLAAEKAKKLNEVTADLAEKQREAAYTAEQLAQVEARRAAGLPTDIAVTNEMTKALDAQALATFKASNAKAQAEKLAAVKKGLNDDKFDLQNKQDAKTDPIGAQYRAQAKAIEDRRQARLLDIEAMGLEAEAAAELKAQSDAQAAGETADAEVDAASAKADILSERLRGMFEDPKESLKGLLKDTLEYFAKALIQSMLLNKSMSGGGGLGGMIGGAISSALGFGGGRATGGGVSGSEYYMVGEKGPELFAPGGSGTIIPNHALSGGGSSNVKVGGSTIIINGAKDPQATAAAVARKQETAMRNIARDVWKNGGK